jgi:hypothetical protein
VARRRLAAERAELGQQRVARHLEPPALVVGQVQVQPVQLVHRHQVDVAVQELDRQVPARDVQQAAAPGITWHVHDPHRRQITTDEDPRRVRVGRQQLAQRLHRPAQPGQAPLGAHALGRDGQPVALLTQLLVGDLGEHHAGRGGAAGGGKGALAGQLAQ